MAPGHRPTRSVTSPEGLQCNRIRGMPVSSLAETVEGVAERVVLNSNLLPRAVLGVADHHRTWLGQRIRRRPSRSICTTEIRRLRRCSTRSLPSPMAFLPTGRPRRMPDEPFEAIYAVWSELPEDSRPKLVLFGESLGACWRAGCIQRCAGHDRSYRRRSVGRQPQFHASVGEVSRLDDAGSREILPVIDGGEHAIREFVRGSRHRWSVEEPNRLLAARIRPRSWWSPDLIPGCRPDWPGTPLRHRRRSGVQWFPFVIALAIDLRPGVLHRRRRRARPQLLESTQACGRPTFSNRRDGPTPTSSGCTRKWRVDIGVGERRGRPGVGAGGSCSGPRPG